METIVINLFGEPSAGKSTCAMDITAQLKRNGINAEYVSEFAKDRYMKIMVRYLNIKNIYLVNNHSRWVELRIKCKLW